MITGLCAMFFFTAGTHVELRQFTSGPMPCAELRQDTIGNGFDLDYPLGGLNHRLYVVVKPVAPDFDAAKYRAATP
jgi:hypothetical protein